MRNRLPGIFAATLFVIWIAVIVLVVCSSRTVMVICYARHGTLIRIHAKENGIAFGVFHGWPIESGFFRQPMTPNGVVGPPVMFDGSTYRAAEHLLGIGTDSGTGTAILPAGSTVAPTKMSGWNCVIPWYLILLAATAMCALIDGRWLFLKIRRLHRADRNCCQKCGYDFALPRSDVPNAERCSAKPRPAAD